MLTWLYPNKCIICGDIIPPPDAGGFCRLCGNPFTEISPFCDICGRGLVPGGVCECRSQDIMFTKNRCLFEYDGVMSDVIHAFKYGNHPAHARALGRLMAGRLDMFFENIKLDLIIPTPMYRLKERLRGFNQAALLAGEISRLSGVALDGKSLARVKNTAAQFGLSAAERKTNLSGAFRLAQSSPRVVGKNILLVDDIFTTGSTLNECAAELFRGGASAVYGYCLAAAVWKGADENGGQAEL